MKKSCMILLFSTLASMAWGQGTTKTLVTGTLSKAAADTFIVSGFRHERFVAPISNAGTFRLEAAISPGVYRSNAGLSLYLEPGMALDLSLQNGKPVFKGKGAAENTVFNNLPELMVRLLPFKGGTLTPEGYSMEPDVFAAAVEKYTAEATRSAKDAGCSADFTTLISEIAAQDGKYVSYMYRIYYGTDAAKQEEMRKFLTQVRRDSSGKANPEDIRKLSTLSIASRTKIMSAQDRVRFDAVGSLDPNNERMFIASASYRELFEPRLTQMRSAERSAERLANPGAPLVLGNAYEEKMLGVSKLVTNPVIREYLLYYNGDIALKTGKDKGLIYEKYMSLAKDEVYRAAMSSTFAAVKKMEPGTLSPGFTFNTPGGTPVSLASLKGNYVYIDFWATWCGPCIAEIPHLKNLERDYKGKKISFVSISTDSKGDIPKWKKFVADSALTGTQLISNRESEFIKFYNIATIPRFVLLDPEGKIVSADADRPSTAAIRKKLDELLKTP